MRDELLVKRIGEQARRFSLRGPVYVWVQGAMRKWAHEHPDDVGVQKNLLSKPQGWQAIIDGFRDQPMPVQDPELAAIAFCSAVMSHGFCVNLSLVEGTVLACWEHEGVIYVFDPASGLASAFQKKHPDPALDELVQHIFSLNGDCE